MLLNIPSLSALPAAAKQIVEALGDRTIVAFHGKMGAGKTTLIKALCAELGVDDTVNSPTFSIVNEYRSAQTGELIYHFDFYRIERIEEVFDMGYEDYFYSGALCFVEWPELIANLLPADAVDLTIEELPDGSRRILLEAGSKNSL